MTYQDPYNIGQHGADYLGHAEAFVDMFPHVNTLVGLARECHTILELGTRSGSSTWAFLTGLAVTGELTSVDSDPRVFREGWLPPQVYDDPRFTFIEGDDLDEDIIARYPKAPDLVFIDTSHTYQQTLRELYMVVKMWPNRIVLHDWALEDVENSVMDFLRIYRKYRIEQIEKSQWGLAVLRLRA
jgi:predicted O-methyltransferase YrrM